MYMFVFMHHFVFKWWKKYILKIRRPLKYLLFKTENVMEPKHLDWHEFILQDLLSENLYLCL